MLTRVPAGDRYIEAIKLRKGATEAMYVESDRKYYLNCEDIRFVDMEHTIVAVRQSARRVVTNSKKTYEFNVDEIESLKRMCWQPLHDCVNL